MTKGCKKLCGTVIASIVVAVPASVVEENKEEKKIKSRFEDDDLDH